MNFADTFLPEFDAEMKTTRSLLERVPFDKADWKPHTKSMSLGALASHVAELPGYGVAVATQEEMDFAPKNGAPPRTPPNYKNTEELLAAFDGHVQQTRARLVELKPEKLGTTWTLRAGDHVIAAMPRVAALRTIVMNHVIHHRGQLSVYLRLNDVPLPSIYGPTADT